MSENNTNLSSPFKGDKRGSVSSRLEWLDAMRGFTMILVVTYHVAQIGFHMNAKFSSVQPFLVLFRMPLFFLVSGFLAYKVGAIWNGTLLRKMTWKKLKIQILPAVVFFGVSMLLLHKHPMDELLDALKSPTKNGYWFTWVLLHMFLIYYAYEFLMHRIRTWKPQLPQWHVSLPLLWVASVVCYELTYVPPFMKWCGQDFSDFLDWTSLIQTVRYLQFFLFGIIIHKYWTQVQRLMDTNWFFIVVLLLAFIGAGDYLKWHNLKFMWANLPRTIGIYALVMLVVMFFRHYQSWFTKEKKAGRFLQYIGTRTLDIYLLHFLFIPTMPFMGPWFKAHRGVFVLDFAATFSIAMLVIAFCLITSHLLRINPILSEYLFGRKKQQQKTHK